MANPSRNIHYTDLGWSFYPAKIDSRDGKNPSTGSVDPINYAVNTDLEVNVDYENKGSSPTAKDYYVLAGDVNVLQDIALSIERVLGIMPQGEFRTVGDRLEDLSDMSRFDERLGGVGWTNISVEYPGQISPTILSHRHSGQPWSAPKIDLSTESTGRLGSPRIQLANTDPDQLAGDIIMSQRNSSVSIKEALDSKIGKDGGTITGSLKVQGNTICRLFAEFDCKDFGVRPDGSNVSDNDAYSGIARRFQKALAFDGVGYSIGFPLRYGEYSVTLRAKCTENTSSANVLRIVVWEVNASGGNSIVLDKYIKANHFYEPGRYQQFYHTVVHNYSGSSNKNMYVGLWYHGNGVSDVSLDSLSVMPVHTAVWDE